MLPTSPIPVFKRGSLKATGRKPQETTLPSENTSTIPSSSMREPLPVNRDHPIYPPPTERGSQPCTNKDAQPPDEFVEIEKSSTPSAKNGDSLSELKQSSSGFGKLLKEFAQAITKSL